MVAGLLALLLLVSASRPSNEDPRLGASLEVTVADVGELEISHADPLPVVSDRDLRAGRLETGSLEVRNITNRPLGVGFALPAAELETGMLAAAQIRIRIASGTRVLADTTLPGLVKGSGLIPLGPGRSREFDFQAWIGGSAPGLYAGQDVAGRLQFELVPIGGGR